MRRRRRGDDNSSSWNDYNKLLLTIGLALIQFLPLVSSQQHQPFVVTANPSHLSASPGLNISLVCTSSARPILCLWKTPYGHIYTLSEGVFAESGRLRHLRATSPREEQNCGLQIVGVQVRDAGTWECEVGAVVREDFRTKTSEILLEVETPSGSLSNGAFGGVAVQEVGDDVILNCSSDREVHLCRWKTPYLNTYIVGEGIYVERGRIAWRGSNPNFDCTIHVSHLELRDAGTWVCEIGSSTKDNFQVQTKEFQIEIEPPLKLSAPTSLMQNANTDATLVCHANKPFDTCLWTTPYGATYSFPTTTTTHEEGRIAFFGFTETDCGVIVRNVGPEDNGGWQCQLHTKAGDFFQNATDVVPLFTGGIDSSLGEGSAQPRAILDYDYSVGLEPAGPSKGPPVTASTSSSSAGSSSAAPPLDAIDYIDGDFARVEVVEEPTAQEAQRSPITVQVVQVEDMLMDVRDLKRIGSPSSDKSKSLSTTPRAGFASILPTTEPTLDFSSVPTATFDGSLPILELSKLAPSTPRTFSPPSSRRTPTSPTTTVAAPLSIFGGKTEQPRLSGVNPIELELLSRISDTRRGDSRPVRINLGGKDEEAEQPDRALTTTPSPPVRFNPRPTVARSRTTLAIRNRNRAGAERTPAPSLSPAEGDRMRRLEIQRIRDERRKKQKEISNRDREEERRKQLREEEEKRKQFREEERRKQLREEEEKRKRLQEEERRRDRLRQQDEERRRQRLKEEEERKQRIKAAEEERQRKIKEEEEKLRKLKEEEELRLKRIREEEERLKKLRAEEERLRKLRQEEELKAQRRKEEQERERKRLERLQEQERLRKLEEQRQRELEERKRRQKEEEERKRRVEEERRRKLAEEERKREEEEERKKKLEEEERKKKEEEDRRRKQLEEERKRKAEEEKKRKEEEERKRREEEEEKRKEAEAKRELERLQKLAQERRLVEDRRRIMAEMRRKEAEEKARKEAERKKKEEEERKRKEEEEERLREEAKKKAVEEARRKAAEDARKAEIERLRRIEEEKKRQEAERRREEERKRKLEEERKRAEEQKRKEEQRRRIEAERKRKEEEERAKRIELARKREELEIRRKQEAERIRKEEEARQKVLEEQRQKELEEQKKAELEKQRREEEIRKSLERIREEKRQRELALRREEERLRVLRAKEEEERKRKEALEKKMKEEEDRERERQRQKEIQEEIERTREEERRRIAAEEEEKKRREEIERRKEERERRRKEEQLERAKKAEEERRRREELLRTLELSSSTGEEENSNTRKVEIKDNEGNLRKKCLINASPDHGNITCGGVLPDRSGDLSVTAGDTCLLTCNNGFVSRDSREARCINGLWTRRLECVRPDAMILIGGRSDTHGVLNSVELVTGRGVCRGAVPHLPAMRWRAITASIAEDKVMTCGGVNIFGDPKTSCWILGFDPDPAWTSAEPMNVARDAAAWAFEDNFLFVLGGSLGKLNGYTDSVEMYSVEAQKWLEGPAMSSSRYSHCAVGLGNGSIIVTGGYGGLSLAERLDLATGKWHQLPELNPVRAQHGCALVQYRGEEGVIVIGGDSGGTRLKDVRFLPLNDPREWHKVTDLNTARWGRPAVGVIGGRITVAAGWDGVRDLSTVEYYDEQTDKWKLTASRLQTERRWTSSTPISLSLFPKCVQKRS